MRRLPIRLKLVGALAVPLLTLLGVVVAEVVRTSHDVHRVRDQAAMATAAIGPSGLMTALEDERNWTVVALIGQETAVTLPVTGFDRTRRATDEAITAFRGEVAGKGGAVADAYGPALQEVQGLQELRADVDAHREPRSFANNEFANGIFDRYATLISPFEDANSRLALAIDDPALRRGVELVDVTSRQIEVTAGLVRAIVEGQIHGMARADINAIAAVSDKARRYEQAIREAGSPYAAIVAQHVPRSLMAGLLAQADKAKVGRVDINAVLATANVPVEDSYPGLRDAIARRLRRDADLVAADADHRISLLRALAAVAVLIAGLATWIVSRSITGPLHVLTRQATDMAHHRLPEAVTGILETPLGDDVEMPALEAVTVSTQDEVADVAQALNTVQTSALSLAVGQAVLRRNIADAFVNLGRRNQNLLGRQLDFITELESNETDPDTLANLFRLDHLATRMRRNAESLLLLAGVDPPRTWTQPVRVADVIRAALGEVEDYQRVVDRGIEPALVHGTVAADLAHLLAELIDNALAYSAPDQPVEVRGVRRTDPWARDTYPSDGPATAPGEARRSDDRRLGYTLVVVDAGLGIPPRELTHANQRLAGRESFTIAPSKYLGHYVAGHLAARHDIAVTLHDSPGSGVTAVVVLPASLLADPHVPLPPAMPAPTF